MTVITYEKSERTEACQKKLLASKIISSYKMLTILPIPFSRDGFFLSGCDVPVESLCSGDYSCALVVGYAIPGKVRDRLGFLGATVVDCALDEKFLLENAYLTALGTVKTVLDDGTRSPEDLRVGIVGYGRIGKALLRMLLSLGASPSVYTSRDEVALCLGESGIMCEKVASVREITGLDYLVNTSPSAYLSGVRIEPRVKILELCPGENFSGGELVRLPSLPARFFPVSAGEKWAESAIRLLEQPI